MKRLILLVILLLSTIAVHADEENIIRVRYKRWTVVNLAYNYDDPIVSALTIPNIRIGIRNVTLTSFEVTIVSCNGGRVPEQYFTYIAAERSEGVIQRFDHNEC